MMAWDSIITWLIVVFAAIYLARRLLTKGSGCGGCGGGCSGKTISGVADLRKSRDNDHPRDVGNQDKD